MSVAPLDPLNGIEVESLSKRYLVSKDSGSRLGSFLFNRWNTRREQTVVHALKDVSFSVARGEMVGIVGTNGSGKSTLLRAICGITQSDSGTVRRLPRVSALLDLFAGFHPTLTGYENLFLNASILGISRRELREKLPEIIKYSGIEPAYLDSPVRFYSAGMKARLGFSLAVQFEPDIVLVDEVLAVGDLEFQEKSAIRILEFREQGKAMILVSHSIGTIQQLCSQAIWLDKGHVRMSGTATQVVTAYTQFLQERSLSSLGREEGLVSNVPLPGVDHLGAVTLLDSSNQTARVFQTGGPMRVAIETKSNQSSERFDYQIIIRHNSGSIVIDTLISEYVARNAMPDGSSFQFHMDALPLTGGHYELQIAALATATPAHTVDRSPWVAFEIPVSHYNYDVYPADIPVKLSVE